MALRTFTRPGVLVADATTISQPATIEPPFREPVPDKMTPDKHSEPWNAFFTELAKRLSDIQASGGVIFGVPPGATTYFGNASTDGSGHFTATWSPAFTTTFGGFSVVSADPAYPGATLAATTIALSSYVGFLSRTDNLVPTPTTAPITGTTFNWIAWGW